MRAFSSAPGDVLRPQSPLSASTVVCLLPEGSGIQVTLDDGLSFVLLDPLSTGGATSISQQPSVVPKSLSQSFAIFWKIPGHILQGFLDWSQLLWTRTSHDCT